MRKEIVVIETSRNVRASSGGAVPNGLINLPDDNDAHHAIERGRASVAEDAILARLDTLESESTIRHVVARYFGICDHLGPDTPFDELGRLFTRDAQWQSNGRYQAPFGDYHGRREIVAMLRNQSVSQPRVEMSAHFLSSERLAISGDSASGEWMLLQTSSYTDGDSDLHGAMLSLRFTREDRRWRIARFSTKSLFSRRVDLGNDAPDVPVLHRVQRMALG